LKFKWLLKLKLKLLLLLLLLLLLPLTLNPLLPSRRDGLKGGSEAQMSERSEFLRFPSFKPSRREPAQRAQGAGSPFFAYLLWRSKESERLPGRTRLARPKKGQHRATEETTPTTPIPPT
jgi:hypothetical protein